MYYKDFPAQHDHDYWEFFMIQAGEIKHIDDNGAQTLGAGTGCLVHPQDIHSFKKRSINYQQINIMITDDYLQQLISVVDKSIYEKIKNTKGPIFYKLNDSFITSISNTIDLLHFTKAQNKEHFADLVKLMWLDIIKLVYTNLLITHKEYPAWLNDFIIMLKQPENIGKNINELAAFSSYSYSHLIRLFKKHTGVTLVNYISRCRLNYAAMLLRTTDEDILSISLNIGYDSLSHFTQLFKKKFGVPPNEYRHSTF